MRSAGMKSLLVLTLLLLLLPSVASVHAFSTGQAASVVLGQPNFTTNATTTTSMGMNGPAGVAINPTGPVWVTDQTNNRVLEFVKGTGFTNGEAASLVLGQPDFTHSAPATTATGMNTPEGIVVDQSGNVWVADWGNNRVLEFVKGGGFSDGQPAAVALGQPGFTSDVASATSTGMNGPNDIAFDESGNLWVADTGNNRVLEFVAPFTNGEAASVVLGQPDFTHSAPATTATGMNTPNGLWIDPSGNVWVADSGNNRVLEFVKGTGFTNGEAASLVLGQPDFVHASPTTVATGMNTPNDVVVGAFGNVWVADFGNNRVLEFVAPFTNGEAASVVLGQPDFTTNATAITSTGMNGPNSVALDQSGNLWVADFGNNRVLEFQIPASTTSVVCNPISFNSGSASLCTVKVSGNSPTGTVNLSQTGGSGSVTFPSGSACSLSTAGNCSVTVIGAVEGGVDLQATYGGDSDNAASNGTTSVTVLAVNTTTTTTTSSSSAVTTTSSSSTSITSTSTTRTTTSSSSSSSTTTSPSMTSSRTSTSGEGEIPELPPELGISLLLTIVIVASYIMARRGLKIGKQSPI